MGDYSVAEVAKIRKQAFAYALNGREVLSKYTNSELAEIYNGAGPDSWSTKGRELTTKLMNLFKPVILIHDVQFDESDGSDDGFQRTKENWEYNCRLIFDIHYPLLTPKILSRSYRVERAYWWTVLKAGTVAISSGSAREAWQDAYKRRKDRDK